MWKGDSPTPAMLMGRGGSGGGWEEARPGLVWLFSLQAQQQALGSGWEEALQAFPSCWESRLSLSNSLERNTSKQKSKQVNACRERTHAFRWGINNLSAHPEEYTLQGETCYNSDFCKHPNNEMKYNCPLRGKKYLSIVSSGCQIKISVFAAPIWRFYLYNMIQYRPGECITHRTNMKAKK